MHRFIKTVCSFVFCVVMVLGSAQFSSVLYSSQEGIGYIGDVYVSIDSDFNQEIYFSLGKEPDGFKRVTLHKYLVPSNTSSDKALPITLIILSKTTVFDCQSTYKDPVSWFGTQIV